MWWDYWRTFHKTLATIDWCRSADGELTSAIRNPYRWVQPPISLHAEKLSSLYASDDNRTWIHRTDLQQTCSAIVISIIYQQASQFVACPTMCLESLTYYTEFGPRSRAPVHPHRSAGAVPAWRRTGAGAGPPGPSCGQRGLPGLTVAYKQRPLQQTCWQ